MARVNIEDRGILAAIAMSESLKWPHFGALSHLVLLWNMTQERGTDMVSPDQLAVLAKLKNKDAQKFINAGIEFGFFENTSLEIDGQRFLVIKIRGNSKHISNLKALKDGNTQGGVNRAKSAERDENGRMVSRSPHQVDLVTPSQVHLVTPTSAMQGNARQCNAEEEEDLKGPSPKDPPPTVDEISNKIPTPRQLANLWNEIAAPNMPRVDDLTSNQRRYTWAKERLHVKPDLGYWRSVIERMNLSPFCCGQNNRGWVADFEFLVRKDSAVKILEGKYDDKAPVQAKPKRDDSWIAKAKADMEAEEKRIDEAIAKRKNNSGFSQRQT